MQTHKQKLRLWEVEFGSNMMRRTISGATIDEVLSKANSILEGEVKDWKKDEWDSLEEAREAYEITQIELLATED